MQPLTFPETDYYYFLDRGRSMDIAFIYDTNTHCFYLKICSALKIFLKKRNNCTNSKAC